MALYMNLKEYEEKKKTLRLSCNCSWRGKASEAYGELHETVLDFECPKCNNMLLIVNLIVDPEKYFNWKKKKN